MESQLYFFSPSNCDALDFGSCAYSCLDGALNIVAPNGPISLRATAPSLLLSRLIPEGVHEAREVATITFELLANDAMKPVHTSINNTSLVTSLKTVKGTYTNCSRNFHGHVLRWFLTYDCSHAG